MADCPAGIEVGVTVAGDSIKQITYREQGCGNRSAQLTVGNFPGNLRETGCPQSFSRTQCERVVVDKVDKVVATRRSK